jgi:hypothetical protein
MWRHFNLSKAAERPHHRFAIIYAPKEAAPQIGEAVGMIGILCFELWSIENSSA